MNTLDELRSLLAERADSTSPVPRIADEAVRDARRAWVQRRSAVVAAVVVAAAVVAVPVLVSSLSSTAGTDSAGTVPQPDVSGGDTPAPVDGGTWRWESYGGIELQVPADWGYGISDTPWCGGDRDEPAQAVVGRPGPVRLLACAPHLAPADLRSPYVWFGTADSPRVEEYDEGWVEETRQVGDVPVTILARIDQLRAEIFASARMVADVDVHGCPVQHPISADPAHRPDPSAGGLATLGEPTEVSACTYALGHEDPDGPPAPLLASSRITDEAAVALVDALESAPEGIGPDDPGDCSAEAALGDRALVLRISDGASVRDVYVRHAGCVGHGVDDGVVHRMMTTAVAEQALVGPHQPTFFSSSMADLL